MDEFFDYRYGKLPYRSLEFKHETHDTEMFSASAGRQLSERVAYTRVTEFKYLTGQEHHKTSIVYEFPRGRRRSVLSGAAPGECRALSKVSRLWPMRRRDVHFVGRLATYKYYNMDQVVAQALTLYSKMVGLNRKVAAQTEVAAKVNL